MEENKKRMEELYLPLLTQAFKNSSSPKSSPMKNTKPRIARKELVPVRRSERFSNKPVPQYKEVIFYERVQIPRRVTHRTRDLSSEEARDRAKPGDASIYEGASGGSVSVWSGSTGHELHHKPAYWKDWWI